MDLIRTQVINDDTLETADIDSPKFGPRPRPVKRINATVPAKKVPGNSLVETILAQCIHRRKHLKVCGRDTNYDCGLHGANRAIADDAVINIQACAKFDLSAMTRSFVSLLHRLFY